MKANLAIWWGGDRVGLLGIDDHGDIGFTYDPDWLASTRPKLSQSLPKRAEPFNRAETRPFFAGLLPEEMQRESVARILGLSRNNDFAMLEALGRDVAGAITIWPEGTQAASFAYKPVTAALTADDLADVIATLPQRPLLAGEDGLRVSLAGAQAKLPVVLVDGEIALPTPNQPSTHIVKPAITHLAYSTENEAYAMRLASAVGLKVAHVEQRKAGDNSFLLVRRYDRTSAPPGHVTRLHQEDFCQALGVSPEKKYAREGGPTFKHSFQLLTAACTFPAIERLRLLDAALFNLVIGNADAHGKNYSLLYTDGETRLAPLYDLMCTVAYPHVAVRMAMKIGEARTIDELRPDTWKKFAEDAVLGAAYVRSRASFMVSRAAELAVETASRLTSEGGDADELMRLAELVRSRCALIAANLERPLPARRVDP